MRGKPLFRLSMRSDVINGFFDTVAGPNLLNQLNPAAKRSKVEAAQIYSTFALKPFKLGHCFEEPHTRALQGLLIGVRVDLENAARLPLVQY